MPKYEATYEFRAFIQVTRYFEAEDDTEANLVAEEQEAAARDAAHDAIQSARYGGADGASLDDSSADIIVLEV